MRCDIKRTMRKEKKKVIIYLFIWPMDTFMFDLLSQAFYLFKAFYYDGKK